MAPRTQAPFTFVSDGVESTIAQAQQVDGANVVQQAVQAGLVGEIGIELIPVLLGSAVRYFENLGSKPIQLAQTQAVQGIGVTHLRYRVVK